MKHQYLNQVLNYLSTHPALDERIHRSRAQWEDYQVMMDETAKMHPALSHTSENLGDTFGPYRKPPQRRVQSVALKFQRLTAQRKHPNLTKTHCVRKGFPDTYNVLCSRR